VKQLVEFCNFWIATASKRGSARILVGSTDVRGAISASISRGKLVASRPSSAFMFATQLSSPRHHHPKKNNNSHSQESDHDTKLSGADMVCKFANPWWTEIRVLALRSVMNIKRMPELFLMRLATVLFTAFLLATIFWNLDHSPLGIQVRPSSLLPRAPLNHHRHYLQSLACMIACCQFLHKTSHSSHNGSAIDETSMRKITLSLTLKTGCLKEAGCLTQERVLDV
jgi:hypothetical protein